MRWIHVIVMAVTPISLLMSGCDEDKDKVARVATEAAERQARQNEEMANLNREVAKAHEKLIEEQTNTRKDAMVVQGQIVQQQAELSKQSVAVDDERRDLAKQRYWEPIWAELIGDLAALVACVLPLVVCGYLLHRSPAPVADEVSDVLLDHFVIDAPKLNYRTTPSLETSLADEEPALPMP